MKQGRGMCSTFQSFLFILPNVPCLYFVHRYIWPQLCSVWTDLGTCIYHLLTRTDLGTCTYHILGLAFLYIQGIFHLYFIYKECYILITWSFGSRIVLHVTFYVAFTQFTFLTLVLWLYIPTSSLLLLVLNLIYYHNKRSHALGIQKGSSSSNFRPTFSNVQGLGRCFCRVPFNDVTKGVFTEDIWSL